MQQSIMDEKERIREIEIIVKSLWGNIHPINTSQGLRVSHTHAGMLTSRTKPVPVFREKSRWRG